MQYINEPNNDPSKGRSANIYISTEIAFTLTAVIRSSSGGEESIPRSCGGGVSEIVIAVLGTTTMATVENDVIAIGVTSSERSLPSELVERVVVVVFPASTRLIVAANATMNNMRFIVHWTSGIECLLVLGVWGESAANDCFDVKKSLQDDCYCGSTQRFSVTNSQKVSISSQSHNNIHCITPPNYNQHEVSDCSPNPLLALSCVRSQLSTTFYHDE